MLNIELNDLIKQIITIQAESQTIEVKQLMEERQNVYMTLFLVFQIKMAVELLYLD